MLPRVLSKRKPHVTSPSKAAEFPRDRKTVGFMTRGVLASAGLPHQQQRVFQDSSMAITSRSPLCFILPWLLFKCTIERPIYDEIAAPTLTLPGFRQQRPLAHPSFQKRKVLPVCPFCRASLAVPWPCLAVPLPRATHGVETFPPFSRQVSKSSATSPTSSLQMRARNCDLLGKKPNRKARVVTFSHKRIHKVRGGVYS